LSRLGIDWRLPVSIISDKDASWLLLGDDACLPFDGQAIHTVKRGKSALII